MKREPTGVIEGRVSHISVATLAMFAQQNGLVVTSKSQLVRLAFDLAADILTEQKAVPEIATTEQALEILQSLGLSALTRSDKGRGLLRQALEKDERRLEDFNPAQWASELAMEQRSKCETVFSTSDAPTTLSSKGRKKIPTLTEDNCADVCQMIFDSLTDDFTGTFLEKRLQEEIEKFNQAVASTGLTPRDKNYHTHLRNWEAKLRRDFELENMKALCRQNAASSGNMMKVDSNE